MNPRPRSAMSNNDSLDDLLDELEDLGIEVEKDPEPSKPRRPRSPTQTPSPPRRSAGNDLEGDDWDLPTGKKSPPRVTPGGGALPEAKPGGERGSHKCFPVCVGGSRDEQGASPGRACNTLRCTKCDFSVIRFADVAWDAECDYMFFRNFYPDAAKLNARMKKAPGSASYACQCSWVTATEIESLKTTPEMRWVCSGHKPADSPP
eukprot:CAMPEP_0180138860 /NCGR_PEP_ID=MMETSP0986-20121125/13163_1 /TAXON_ID=697907 /ORGANISM="non described non described, Strain CCMP2293" /LENGTH=204 /DNA_ID=CAMNT_0022080801 /DNA_START=67 /DNA_END=681 /DNA_ORIENTATION=+